MKSKILLSFLSTAALTTSLQFAHAQSNNVYAITGETEGSVNWTVVRELDANSGAIIRNIYLPAADKPVLIDATTKKPLTLTTPIANPNNGVAFDPSMSAATAYDAKNNRLYFTPLFSTALRYVDLSAPTLTIAEVRSQQLKSFTSEAGEGDNITRMAFAADGFGYALTNNGKHLIRFTSAENVAIADLGSLHDGDKNNGVSVHEMPANWGGDMVADAFGNLYLFTNTGNIFKINPNKLVADFVGKIKQLPQGFTVNAAAVDNNGFVLISSSTNTENYYRVNLSTLMATAVDKKNEKIFNASDFASANFAFQNNKNVLPFTLQNRMATTFPNPVVNKRFTVVLKQPVNQKVTVELTDIAGTKVLLHTTTNQLENISLPAATSAGTYMLRIIDSKGATIHNDKLVVQ